jgi:hypothetical protein
MGAAALAGVYILTHSITPGPVGIVAAGVIASFISAAFHTSAYGVMRRSRGRQSFLRSKRHVRQFLAASLGLQVLGFAISTPFDIIGDTPLSSALRFGVACVCTGALCAWAVITARTREQAQERESTPTTTPTLFRHRDGAPISGASISAYVPPHQADTGSEDDTRVGIISTSTSTSTSTLSDAWEDLRDTSSSHVEYHTH